MKPADPSRRPFSVATAPLLLWLGILNLGILYLGGLAGCATRIETFETDWNQREGTFSVTERVALQSTRANLAAGNHEVARAELARLAERDPENLVVGALLQDVELEILAAARRGVAPEDEALARLARDADPEGALARRYTRSAEETPSVARLVLAARLERDTTVALVLLDRALVLDPRSAWAHYGRAHTQLTDRDDEDRWSRAREAVEAALAAEPGFLRARRLRAWMLAEEGQKEQALAALDAWLEASLDDPRVDPEVRVEARLDRALLLVLTGSPERAVRELEALEGEERGRTRRLTLLAVAELERGDLERALDTTLRAEGAERGSVLPLVQRALLLERFKNDPEGAEELWRAIAERGGEADELADLVQTLRARVHLERREAAPKSPR